MIFLEMLTDGFSSNAKIISIAIKYDNENFEIRNVWDFKNEDDMVLDFISWFTAQEDKIIAGYNILKFHIPLLLLRAKKFKNFEDFFVKINKANIIDIFVYLTFINSGKINSLDFYCQNYNIGNFVSQQKMDLLIKNSKKEEITKCLIRNLSCINDLFSRLWGQ